MTGERAVMVVLLLLIPAFVSTAGFGIHALLAEGLCLGVIWLCGSARNKPPDTESSLRAAGRP